jgi:serine protease Do
MSRRTRALLNTTFLLGGVALMAALALRPAFGARPAPPAAPVAPASPPVDEADDAADAADEVFFLSAGGSWLGVQIADVGGARVKELGLKEEAGAEIKSVLPESPAAAAGLKVNDVIVEYEGTRLLGVAQLTRMVRETPPGRVVRLRVLRDGSARDVSVKVTGRNVPRGPGKPLPRRIHVPHIDIPDIDVMVPDFDLSEVPGPGLASSFMRLGARVEDLGDQLGEYFGVKNGQGVLVRSVRKGGPGDEAGLKAGDVIVKVDGEAVTDHSDLRSALRDRADGSLSLTVLRDRKETTLKVAPPANGGRRSLEAPGQEGDDEEEMHRDAARLRKDVERIRKEARMKAQRELQGLQAWGSGL